MLFQYSLGVPNLATSRLGLSWSFPRSLTVNVGQTIEGHLKMRAFNKFVSSKNLSDMSYKSAHV